MLNFFLPHNAITKNSILCLKCFQNFPKILITLEISILDKNRLVMCFSTNGKQAGLTEIQI